MSYHRPLDLRLSVALSGLMRVIESERMSNCSALSERMRNVSTLSERMGNFSTLSEPLRLFSRFCLQPFAAVSGYGN